MLSIVTNLTDELSTILLQLHLVTFKFNPFKLSLSLAPIQWKNNIKSVEN
jgi:hypothetical protein